MGRAGGGIRPNTMLHFQKGKREESGKKSLRLETRVWADPARPLAPGGCGPAWAPQISARSASGQRTCPPVQGIAWCPRLFSQSLSRKEKSLALGTADAPGSSAVGDPVNLVQAETW